MLTTYKKATEQGIPTHNIQTLILILIQSWHKEYTTNITKYHLLIQGLAKKQNNELIELEQRKTLGLNKSKETLIINPIITLEDNPLQLLAIKEQTDLDSYLPKESHFIVEENKLITEKIKQTNFKFSDKTKQRVTREINEILTHSETEGIGPYQVAEQIKDKFNDLKTWEANRIARTEINRADNEYRFNDIMDNDLIDYVKWHANIDEKTRDSHEHVNGEIVRKGELFSNGLRFPGDPNGPAKEVMNCRCSIVPYIPPFDKVIPTSQDIFTEDDLIDKPEDAGQQFLLETIENTRIVTPVNKGVEITPENIKISKVKQTLKKLTQQTLDGYIKTKKELQSTLDKFLGIPKPKSGINKLKNKIKNPFKQKIPQTETQLEVIKPPKEIIKELEPELQPIKSNPIKTEQYYDKHIDILERKIKRLTNRKTVLEKRIKEMRETQVSLQGRNDLSSEEKKLYNRLFSQRVRTRKKIKSIEKSIKNARIRIDNKKSMKENINAVQNIQNHQEKIRELEQELQPIKNELNHLNKKMEDLIDFKSDVYFKDYPIDKDIQKLQDELETLKTSKFNINNLSPAKQEEWEKLTTELIDEVKDDYPSTQTIERIKANIRVFIKTNSGTFNIKNLSKEEQVLYKDLIQKKKDGKLGFKAKHDLKNLIQKGKQSPEVQKKITKLEKEIKSMEDLKFQQMEEIDRRLEETSKKLQKKIDKLLVKKANVEYKLGKAHIANKTKPSHVVVPKGEITVNGHRFQKYDGIERNKEDYHKFHQVLNSQESNTPKGIRKYSEGSGHFNNHIKLKKEGNTEAIEDNILNALVHPKSIYKLKDNSIIEPLDYFECERNPQLIKDAVKKLKKKLHNGDPKIRKAYDDIYESFEQEEQDFIRNAVEFNEGVVTYSGQSYNRYGHLQEGDVWVAPKCVSSSLTEERTNYFLKRRVKGNDKPIKIRFFHQKCTKQVVVGERSLHPKEAEIVQLQGTKGRVIRRGTEKFEYFKDHWHEITIDTLDILLDCQ